MPIVHNPLDMVKDESGLTWYIAMETDRFLSDRIEHLDRINLSKLTELRAFCEEFEIKAYRDRLGVDFALRDSRVLDDEVAAGDDVILRHTEQYLDIDESRSSIEAIDGVRMVYAIGGGTYGLPVGATRLEIANYYRADEVGFYKPIDFRAVRFL